MLDLTDNLQEVLNVVLSDRSHGDIDLLLADSDVDQCTARIISSIGEIKRKTRRARNTLSKLQRSATNYHLGISNAQNELSHRSQQYEKLRTELLNRIFS